MTAHLNVTRAQQRKRVLIVAANPTTSTVTGWPVGLWWAELTHPYWAFTEAGYDVELRSPQGGALVADIVNTIAITAIQAGVERG